MSEVIVTPKSTTNPDVAAAAAQFLSPVVIELQALAVNGKQAHWHVRGANFIGVHELLDDVVDHAQAYADLAAERVVALGLPVDARIQTVAEKTTAKPLSAGFHKSDVVIAQVIDQIDTALAAVNNAVKELDEIDQTSQDVAIEIARGLDKDRWFLFAHISE
ncbi:DNA starvation/stationary phase protection protein [Cnuibacter physcomitrellae]|uniref:DNA starvation/stationary phase protection protein n=1 Tax=Cnuibacter physcomitrellae TaxID=1619308 RepID=A0A1X9LIB4_9MICO|nr:DNA starvation/stationary phase protection protein [Cnuibacter physcomitrellae]ARJ04903.1 DNA starvation/stationary phase protection protein [Cnuibacter physcomitrellae]MCS5499117.1 DNA starvation/stationary phase protection protein [Cnuibacter physcomitrellae]GGI41612.1 DNA starvation/stationary phase protection protein [Cnuibacter physcomitrellae]